MPDRYHYAFLPTICIGGVVMVTLLIPTRSVLKEYRETIRYLSIKEVIEQRREIFQTINGDAFFPLKTCPSDIRLIFWKKPIGDGETFKLLLFCLGNGCSPDLICKWVLVSQFWAPEKAEKRARQVEFVISNTDSKRIVVVLLRHGLQKCFI